MTEFIDVPGLDTLLAISRDGRVLRKAREMRNGRQLEACELKLRDLNVGGGRRIHGVRISINGKRKEYSLRALLRRAFGKAPQEKKAKSEPEPHEDRILPEGQSAIHPHFSRYRIWENGAVTGVHGKPILQKRIGRYRSAVLMRDCDGKPTEIKTHRLVLEAFVCFRPPGHVACHGPRGSLDNSVGNLRWGTPGSNDEDRVAYAKLRRYGLL